MYNIYGYDLKEDDTVLLEAFESKDMAVRWAENYTRKEDAGGWDKVYVVTLVEIDVGITEDKVVWSFWREPMPWSDNPLEEF